MYAAWAPLGRLAGAGLLAACAFLLSTPDFRMTAVDILRLVAGRKQAQVHALAAAVCILLTTMFHMGLCEEHTCRGGTVQEARAAQLASLADALWRLRVQEKAEDYRRGQQEAGAALLQAAAVVLAPEQLQHLQYDAANGEFGLRLADTMVEWGQKHISLLDAQGRSSFLQEVCCWSVESCLGPPEHTLCVFNVSSRLDVQLR